VRALIITAVALAACSEQPPAHTHTHDGGTVDAPSGSWPFELPAGFPVPRLPAGARLSPELTELGRYLFYDKRLSGNGTQACASCHVQARAFSDGLVTATGSTGQILRRNAMSLTNVAYGPTQTWANFHLDTLEQQALVPMFGDNPIELGITGNEEVVLGRLRDDPASVARFAAAFPDDADPLDFNHVVAALATFERRLISGQSRVDRYRQGDIGALSASELRGQDLFFTEALECHHCHGGFNFTIAVDHAGLATPEPAFFNTGLYNVGGTGAYPATDQGLHELTQIDRDRGRFKPPTLRNIAVTAPYMHDGSMATLEEVVRFYERGGRLTTTGPDAGDGKLNPNKSPFVGGFVITDQERADLIAFLQALTDDAFLADPTLSDPFQ
jgi:cytochrome c peroxidase